MLVVEDIKDAFTRVPLNRLLDVLNIYVPSEEVLQLIRRLLDTGKRHGIRQGGPLSPLLLNLYLHHVLDVPWQKDLGHGADDPRGRRHAPRVQVAEGSVPGPGWT